MVRRDGDVVVKVSKTHFDEKDKINLKRVRSVRRPTLYINSLPVIQYDFKE